MSRFSFMSPCLTLLPSLDLFITDHIFGKKVYLIVFTHKFYQNLACGTHFQFNNDELFERVDWI